MKFVDEVTIQVRAGDGGNGCVAFRREAHVPRGGPSGGDGGDGGSVEVIANHQLSTLLDYRYRQHYKAARGEDGRNWDQYGQAAEDLVLGVPVGTRVIDADTGELLCDLATDGQRFVLARGGQGGRGNIHFKSPWNQAPRIAEPGKPGETRNIRLELKLLADVGLLGMPNAGKSTFISRVSRARPKIADYPFTTLVPNLGVVQLPGDRQFVMADIPGLIEGAAEGAGLGHRFLRHVERTAILIHLLDGAALLDPERDPIADFDILNRELAAFAPDLAAKPQIVVLNKCDLPDAQEAYPRLAAAFAERGIHLHAASTATGLGMNDILNVVWHRLEERAESAPEMAALPQ